MSKFIDFGPEPIKGWKDRIIRIGIPIAIFAIMLWMVLPTLNDCVYNWVYNWSEYC